MKKSSLSKIGKKFYLYINTHKNFTSEQFYKDFAKDVPNNITVELKKKQNENKKIKKI